MPHLSSLQPVAFALFRLKGADPENGELTYSISGEYFRVNKKTGDLTLIKPLDREQEPKIDVIISLTGTNALSSKARAILCL